MTLRHVIAAASMLTLAAFGCRTALAYDRGVTVTTPRGTYTKSVAGGCADGLCSRDAEITGPDGGTVSRSSQCAAGWRLYRCTGTVTGPNGHSLTRHAIGRRHLY